MKAERPFDQLRGLFRASNRDNKELLKFVFEKSDSISLWIIGLAIGGISIFANNIANAQKSICPEMLRPILLLLAISVTTGIIYRSLYLYFFVVLSNTQQGMDIAFSNQKTMDTESVLEGNETFKDLVGKIKNNCGDLSYLIKPYEAVDEKAKAELYNSIVAFYLNTVVFAQTDTGLFIDFAADTYSKFTGIRKEKYLKKISSHNAGRQYKWTLRIVSLFYIIFILTFITALFTFVYAT